VRTKRLAMAAVLAIVTAACGGASGPPNGPTGIDRSKAVSATDDTEKGALCDWFAPMVGGYGNSPTCASYVISAPPDQTICVAAFPVCDVTVGQFADCVAAIVAAQNACTDQALMDAQARPECVAAAACF
jgi:hypothetical protein